MIDAPANRTPAQAGADLMVAVAIDAAGIYPFRRKPLHHHAHAAWTRRLPQLTEQAPQTMQVVVAAAAC